jgi:hypothetical protein
MEFNLTHVTYEINTVVGIWVNMLRSEGKFLVTKFEFRGSLGMSLEGDCHEVEVTLNSELLVTFGMSLEGVCYVLYTTSSYLIWR